MFARAVVLLSLWVLTINASAAVEPNALHRAVIANDLPALTRLLARKKLNIDAQDGIGRTALHYAALLAHRQPAQILLAHNASTKLKDNEDKTPFNHAADNGAATAEHAAVAALLLESMEGVNGRDEHRWSPLNWAVLSQDYALVQHLIDEGATIWRWSPQIAVDVALLMEDREMLAYLIAAAGGVKVVDGRLLEELMVRTARYGDVQALTMLLELGVEVNVNTALISAVCANNLENVKVLLAYGANVNAIESRYVGESTLYIAASIGHLEIAEILIAHGADVNYVSDKSGLSILMEAALSDHLEIVKLLLLHGVEFPKEHRKAARHLQEIKKNIRQAQRKLFMERIEKIIRQAQSALRINDKVQGR